MTVCAHRTDSPGSFASCTAALGKCACGEEVKGEVEAIAQVLADHEGCQPNAGQDNLGSGLTGVDVWSCGIRVPFVERLEVMERLHLATALAEQQRPEEIPA